MSKNSAIILVFSYFATITLHDYDVYSWGLNFGYKYLSLRTEKLSVSTIKCQPKRQSLEL